MKNIYLFMLALVLSMACVNPLNAQTPPQDHWDTASFQFASDPSFLFESYGVVPVNNKLMVYGDTMGTSTYNPASALRLFDPANNSFNYLPYTRVPYEYGMRAGAATTYTAGTNYAFFGSVTSSNYPGLYKYNSSTNAVTTETLTDGSQYSHYGIQSVCFFSPNTNNDSISIFAKFGSTIKVYRKQLNQTGVVVTQSYLNTYDVTKTIVYNDSLFVFASGSGSYPDLFKSGDGINFIQSSALSVLSYNVRDAKILNGQLYVITNDSEGQTDIWKTADGNTFTHVLTKNSLIGNSLEVYKNKVWFAGANTSNSDYRPAAYYINNNNGNDSLSVDTLGRPDNDGSTFRLATVHDSLYLTGDYHWNMPMRPNPSGPTVQSTNDYATPVYKLILPEAGFLLNTNLLCMNATFTITSQCLNTDSVHWVIDNNLHYATSPGATAWYQFSFSTTGTHTVGLIAYGGTHTDTLTQSVSVYSISANVTSLSPSGICLGDSVHFTSSVSASAIPPITYLWNQNPQFMPPAPTTSLSTFDYAPTTAGNYTYSLTATDVHGCADTYTLNITVNPLADIMGTVLTGTPSLPVAGNVILYRYEPVLTQFDSVTYVPTDAAGNYTFTNVPHADYIVKMVPSASTLQVTYGYNAVNWKTATTVSQGCTSNNVQDIQAQPYLNLGATGNGSMAGTIYEDFGYGHKPGGVMAPGNPIGGIVVKGGKNPGGNMFGAVVTGNDGKYAFNNLPAGDYFVLVDIPGLDTNNTYHVYINENDTTNLDFKVDSMKINPINSIPTSVNEMMIQDHLINVFPNPAQDAFSIEYSLLATVPVRIALSDILGREVILIQPLQPQATGNHKQSVPLHDLQAGLYFVHLQINGTEAVIKLLVQ